MSYEQRFSRNFLQIIKKTAADLYNHMSYTALISLLWLITMIPIGFIVLFGLISEARNNPIGIFILLFQLLLITIPYCAFILGPVHCALYYLAGQVIEDAVELKSVWKVLRQNYALAAKTYAIYVFLLLFTVVDFYIAFFLFSSLFMKIIGIILFYMLLFLLAMGIYLPGFIMKQQNTMVKVWKKTLFVVMDNTMLTLLMGIAFLLFPVLMWYVKILIPLLIFGYGGFLQFAGVRTFLGILEKYPDPVDQGTNLPDQGAGHAQDRGGS